MSRNILFVCVSVTFFVPPNSHISLSLLKFCKAHIIKAVVIIIANHYYIMIIINTNRKCVGDYEWYL